MPAYVLLLLLLLLYTRNNTIHVYTLYDCTFIVSGSVVACVLFCIVVYACVDRSRKLMISITLKFLSLIEEFNIFNYL
jgi:hypothetical protein